MNRKIYEQIEQDRKVAALLDNILEKGTVEEKRAWVDATLGVKAEVLSPITSRGVVLDSVQDKTLIQKATQNNQIVTMDSIQDGEKLLVITPVREVLMDAIQTEGVSSQEILSLFRSFEELAGSDKLKVALDSVNELVGAEMVRQVVVSNANIIVNSTLGGAIGHVSNFKQGVSNGMGTTYMVFSQEAIVTNGKGDLPTGTILDSRNIFQNVASLARSTMFKKETDKLTYTFDVKVGKGDADNYKIKVGRTSVDFGLTGVTLDDQGADQNDTTYTTDKNLPNGGGKVTLEINYPAGTVKAILADNATLADGEIISVVTQLDDEKLSEIRTLIGQKYTPHVYTPSPIDIGATIRIDREKEIKKNIGTSVLPSTMQTSMSMISSSNLKRAIGWFTGYAKVFEVISIKMDLGLGTTQEYYKLLMDSISRASTSRLTLTNIQGADNTLIIGGSGLEKIFNLANSGTNTNTNKERNSANGFRRIGLLNGDYPSYFYPNYDEENPKCDENGVVTGDAEKDIYDSITVVGMPIDATKAMVIKGTTSPIVPLKVKMNEDLEVTFMLHGDMILMPNKDPRSKQLSTKILFKQ